MTRELVVAGHLWKEAMSATKSGRLQVLNPMMAVDLQPVTKSKVPRPIGISDEMLAAIDAVGASPPGSALQKQAMKNVRELEKKEGVDLHGNSNSQQGAAEKCCNVFTTLCCEYLHLVPHRFLRNDTMLVCVLSIPIQHMPPIELYPNDWPLCALTLQSGASIRMRRSSATLAL